jgi:hypothetical protein
MIKKDINISEQLITSIIVGLATGVICVFIAHLMHKEWSYLPISEGGYFTGNSRIVSCGYKCKLGVNHAADCSGITVSEVGRQTFGFNDLMKDSFEGHTVTTLLVALITALLCFVFKHFRFRIIDTKE